MKLHIRHLQIQFAKVTIAGVLDSSVTRVTFSLSRTTVEVSHLAAGEHIVPGPFHLYLCDDENMS
jgi:hypothetical protein